MVTTTTRNFSTLAVCKLAGVSFLQLDYWARMGYLQPTRVHPDPPYGDTQGNWRVWSTMEAAKACALAGMLRAGITHAKAVELIKEGRTATLATRDLRDSIVDDLPPDSRPDVVVRGTG